MKTIIKKISVLIIVAIVAITNVSCKKGDTGTPGVNGNANVQAQTFVAKQFVYNSVKNNYQLAITDNQITQAIIDKGIVCAYIDLYTSAGQQNGCQLPITSLQMDISYTLNQALITTPNSSVNGYYQQVKIVVIPAPLKKQNVNYSNYNEVKVAYNI